MAKKPFYSMEEVCEKLGKTEEEIKGLVRDGELREFRDAGKVFFKSEDIDKLAGPSGDEPEEIILEAAGDMEQIEDVGGGSASGELPALVESSGGTSIIGLEPLEDESSDDEDEEKEDTSITTSGIGVFDDDELEIDADPMAKTQITTGTTEADQVSLEGAGSGSGLLDLAREADDTALGADLLDEIYPGEEDAVATTEDQGEPVAAAEEPEAAEEVEEAEEEELEEAPVDAGEAVVPTVLVAGDPSEGMFTGLMVGCVLLMGLGTTIIGGLLQGFVPDFGMLLSDGMNFYYFLGGSVGLVLISLVVGWLIGKPSAKRRR